MAAILDYKMTTTKIVNQSIHFPTAKNVGIATKFEFLYCLSCEISSKQPIEVSILRSKMADQKVFRSIGNIGFWFHRGISFPKMYLVITLHKIRAKIHSNPDYFPGIHFTKYLNMKFGLSFSFGLWCIGRGFEYHWRRLNNLPSSFTSHCQCI